MRALAFKHEAQGGLAMPVRRRDLTRHHHLNAGIE
jgi:hypothetical protein